MHSLSKTWIDSNSTQAQNTGYFQQFEAYKTALCQILKCVAMLAALVGAGVALRYLFGLLEPTSPVGHSSGGGENEGKEIVSMENTSLLPTTLSELRRLPASESTRLSPVMVALMPVGGVSIGFSKRVVLNREETLAFVTTFDTGLVIVNVSDAANPIRKGWLATGQAFGIALNKEGTLAFVANQDTGLVVVNVSDSSHPTQKGNLTMGVPFGVALNKEETLAFVADYMIGLVMVNISDTANLLPKKVLPINSARDVILNREETLAFVVGGTGLVVVDISNTSHPVPKGNLSTGYAFEIVLNKEETLAFVANQDTGLVIVNVSTPSHLVSKDSLPIGTASGVTLNKEDTLAYVANGDARLLVVDVSNISYLVQKGSLSIGQSNGITLNKAGTLAFVAYGDAGLLVVKIENVVSFQIALEVRGTFGTGQAYGIALNKEGTLAFVANQDTGLVVVNVSDSSHPTQKGSLSTGTALGVVLNKEESLAFVANWNDDIGLVIVDVSNASNPVQKGISKTGEAHGITLNPDGTLVFMGSGKGFIVVDVSNPSDPVQKGKLPTTAHPSEIVLSREKSLVFVANEDEGLLVVDVSNASNPIQKGLLATGITNGVTLNREGTLAFVVNLYTKLVVVDVSDTSNMESKGELAMRGGYRMVLNEKETLGFIANQNTGLVVIDVSNLSNPIRKYGIGTGKAVDVVLNKKETLAFVANYDTGLTIVDIYSPYTAIPLVFSSDVMASIPVLKVGYPNSGKLFFFFNENGSAFNPLITSVSQIDFNGRENSPPYWLSFSKLDYQFSGIPTKDWSSKELMIRTEISRNGEKRSSQCSLFIESSLIINISSSKLFIESPASMLSITMQLSNPEAGQFVLKPFGAVSLSFNPRLGQLSGIGTLTGVNTMFQSLLFSLTNESYRKTTTVALTVDDTVNVPKSAVVPLTKFGFNRPPGLNRTLASATAIVDDEFVYPVPRDTFSNPDNNVLTYRAESSSGDPIPDWLHLTGDSSPVFSGTPTEINLGRNGIRLTADNGYGHQVSQVFDITVDRSDFQKFLLFLKYGGIPITVIGVLLKIPKVRNFLRKMWKGESVVKKKYLRDNQDESRVFTYNLFDPDTKKYRPEIHSNFVKEVKMFEITTSVCGTCRVLQFLSHHAYQQWMAFMNPRTHLGWIKVTNEHNLVEFSLDETRFPTEESIYVVQIINTSEYVEEEHILEFPDRDTEHTEPAPLSVRMRQTCEAKSTQVKNACQSKWEWMKGLCRNDEGGSDTQSLLGVSSGYGGD